MTTAIVTGSSTGIGHATALALARAGHQVFGTMRSPERAPQLAETAASEGLDVTVLPLDVDDDASVRRGIGQVLERAGRIDVLVNNAGIGAGGAIEEMPLESFRQVFETNYFGALRCLQAVIPTMREQRSGCIVNVSSVAGRIAVSPDAAYASSKFALEALSEVLAQELGAFGVRVAIVEPGVIETPIFEKANEPRADSHYPHERRMKALFDAARGNPVPPSVVADVIVEIARGGDAKLRHPVGPDALPYLMWRGSLSDEDFVALGALDDAAWADYVRNTFGLDVAL